MTNKLYFWSVPLCQCWRVRNRSSLKSGSMFSSVFSSVIRVTCQHLSTRSLFINALLLTEVKPLMLQHTHAHNQSSSVHMDYQQLNLKTGEPNYFLAPGKHLRTLKEGSRCGTLTIRWPLPVKRLLRAVLKDTWLGWLPKSVFNIHTSAISIFLEPQTHKVHAYVFQPIILYR